MSQHSYLPLAFKAEREKNPEAFTITDADITRNEQAQAKRRAEMEKINPPKPVPARQEYNRLRQELFSLKQSAQGCETRVNNIAGEVHLLEERITGLIKKKKATENPLAERTCEHQIQLLETDLLDAQERLIKAKRDNTLTVKALKNFDQHERIAELKKQLDG